MFLKHFNQSSICTRSCTFSGTTVVVKRWTQKMNSPQMGHQRTAMGKGAPCEREKSREISILDGAKEKRTLLT